MSRIRDMRTLYAYQARMDGELSFESGVIVRILDNTDAHWWMAYDKSTGNSGLVPYNYVEEVVTLDHAHHEQVEGVLYADPQECEVNSKEIAYTVDADKNNNMSNYSDGTHNVDEFQHTSFDVRTKYDYTAQKADELAFSCDILLRITGKSLTHQGWWKAVNNKGESGLIPSNYVEEIASSYLSPSAKKPDVFSFPNHSHHASSHLTTEQLQHKHKNESDISHKPKDVFSLATHRQHKYDANQNHQSHLKPTIAKKPPNLLHERKDPFPTRKAVEAKSSPGIKSLTEQLCHTSASATELHSLDREAWYFGRISRDESETILNRKINDVGDFLVRASESNVGKWALSMKTPDEIKHYKIIYKDGKYIIGHRLFNSVRDMITYYSTKTQIYTDKRGHPIYLTKAATKILME